MNPIVPSPGPAPANGALPPVMQQLAQQLGVDLSGMGQSAPASMSSEDLAATLLQAAFSLSTPYRSPLPPWAQGMRLNVVSEDQYGQVYEAGEGLVYLDTAKSDRTYSTPANKFAAENGGRVDETTVPGGGPRQDYALTVTQAVNLPYTWDREEVADAMERMRAAGIQVGSFDELNSVWGSLVDRAAQTYALTDGERKLTPWDVLDLYKSEAQSSGTFVDPNRTETQIHKSITDISEGQAWSITQSTLQQMLGRDPSDQELRDYAYRMQRMAATNPTITKTITQYKDGEVASTTSKTDAGFTQDDAAMEAYDMAQNDPDYAEYKAASFYFNSLLSALGPIGGQ